METGSSSSSSNSPESLNGLKFGKKIYFEDVGVGIPAKSCGGSLSAGGLPPPPPQVKRGRGVVVQGGQPPRCQVEGCKVDLSDAKSYYSRHKVCGTHSKSPLVIVGGLEQRFCQQCSRFHLLPEFDQGKRSCRRRLAGHNERRRKPPPGSMLSTRYGTLASSILEKNSRAGGFLVDFTTYPRLTRGSEPGSGSGSLYPGPTFYPGSSYTEASDSNCALSLLSNQPRTSHQTSSPGSNYLLNIDGVNMVQPATTHGVAPPNHFSWGLKGNEATSGQFSGPAWGFKDSEASSGSHELLPDLGLGQFSGQPVTGQYSGELELAGQSGRQYMELEHSRAYDSSTQHMHWPL
ncbi:hypothetical protein LguiA_024648 [Lonicera macranthoides]